MTSFSTHNKIERIQKLQHNLGQHAFIADELEARLLEHLPNSSLPANRLDMLRDCSAEMLADNHFVYPEATYDCIIAHLVLLWQEDIGAFFHKMRSMLSPNGAFLFSTMGPETTNRLEIVGDALVKAGFQLPVVDRDVLQLQYDDHFLLSNDLEDSGLTHELIDVTAESSENSIAKFEVIYGYALGNSMSLSSSGKIEIPIHSITLREPT